MRRTSSSLARRLLRRQRTTARNNTRNDIRIKTTSTPLRWSAIGTKLRATVARAVRAGLPHASKTKNHAIIRATMPAVLRVGPYRFFFYSGDRDESPHIHIEREGNTAKFWLKPVR
ncbi:MAG: DUF4160 domain-containing protein, partial [Anaerolineales bacterium]